ncbi:Periplasmic Sensor Signal Transduction Histidine Kinase [Thiobacillus denitrificans ATCC 25259]|uniref:histidine kinase n=1 Tax=Thiobacillus denitrificans (strain ATCC 25259 / T1) TaxID=292415 RepID=Q3SMF7_THIDA|nr:ATP-binding protein [Thiobacillus denitrificans]AAZ96088.1 Periplasmic Sensor Signal Transduction Histidine Kinase [Thiobacillus denitrificans ATCC 25259]
MSEARAYSLRRRLVGLLTAAIALVWLLSALFVYARAHHEADELLDSQLTEVAETLLAIVAAGEVDHFVEELHEHAEGYPVPIAFEIWHTDDGVSRRLVASPGYAGFDTPAPSGFSERTHQDAPWRFYTAQDEEAAYRVVVGQAHGVRERLAREIGLSLLLPAALALPLMALVVWWVVGRTLRPVDAVAREVGALDPRTLSPLDPSVALPDEIAPLRAALNALIERVTRAFENERRFTADAAHELRTPLAALKVQAQVAQRAQADEARRHALGQVVAGVDRMTHLVEQLLTLARVDPARQRTPPEPLDPAATVTQVCAELQPRAAQRKQSLQVDAPSGCQVAVDPVWLAIALRNLVDNAIAYAGAGAHIEVRLAGHGAACTLSVADDGPGVDPGLRSRLSARFVRGESGGDGCGLGLSIAARVAELSNARLELGEGLRRADEGYGFAATLRFAAPG